MFFFYCVILFKKKILPWGAWVAHSPIPLPPKRKINPSLVHCSWGSFLFSFYFHISLMHLELSVAWFCLFSIWLTYYLLTNSTPPQPCPETDTIAVICTLLSRCKAVSGFSILVQGSLSLSQYLKYYNCITSLGRHILPLHFLAMFPQL